MDDLVQWLREQFDEDERIARAAQRQRGGGEWVARADASGIVAVEGLPVRAGEPIPVVLHPDEDETAEHIAEHDPARVLREIDAKRQIIEQHERYAAERRRMMGGWDPQSDDSPILAALATVYADRPGYREEWRP
jgi:hypothetical protein